MKYFALLSLIICVNCAPTNPNEQVIYDQKQSGGTNVQVHLKDLQIIALLGDDLLGDYDYNYDYSDFTIKPPSNTTSVSLKPPAEDLNITSTISSSSTTTDKPSSVPSNSTSPDRIKVQIIQDPSPTVGIVPLEEMGTVHHSPALGEALYLKRCANGFARDKRGRCRRVRRPGQHSQLNIGRLASRLASRIGGNTGAIVK